MIVVSNLPRARHAEAILHVLLNFIYILYQKFLKKSNWKQEPEK
nr:MAG TPA: hypothetical protein [Caudoviricetes sp.]